MKRKLTESRFTKSSPLGAFVQSCIKAPVTKPKTILQVSRPYRLIDHLKEISTK